MSRRFAAVALAAGALSVLTACGGLSSSSAVRQGRDVHAVQDNEVRVLANPVTPGASPEQVVTGFIRAAASDDQYQAARSYLVPAQEGSWHPDTAVEVYPDDSALRIVRSGPGTVTAIAQTSARIDGDGRYHELAPGSSVSARFGLQKVSGEWRIATVPAGFGTWLSEADATRLYDPFRIYFVSATERRLVPDVRWFPVGTGLATRLARALLAGVPDYLRGAVRTDLPAGTQLAVDSVPIESGAAQVDLTAPGLSSDPGQRQGLGAQLLATVSQAVGVDRVALQLEGTDLQVPGAAPVGLESLSSLGFPTPADPVAKPVVRKGSALARVDPQALGGSGERVPAVSAGSLPTIPSEWQSMAMSPSGSELAAVSADRRRLERWRGTTRAPDVTVGSQLSRPTYDSQGLLWLGGRDGDVGRIWVVNTSVDPSDPRARPQPVVAPWLADRVVVSLRFSPDGQRVAVISTDRAGHDPSVDVAGVVRQTNGLPEQLANPLTLAPSLTVARDLVWVDDVTMAVLGRKQASSTLRPWLVPLGGPITAGPEIAGATSITTVNAERGLVVTTSAGQVFVRAGSRWQVIPGATDFVVPGR